MADTHQDQVIADLLELKHRVERPSFATALPVQDEKLFLPLVRKLYSDANPANRNFFAQDKDGFPSETYGRLATTVGEEIVYPTLALNNVFDPAKWANLPRPSDYAGAWPPTQIEHLLSPSGVDECIWDNQHTLDCGCAYEEAKTNLFDSWTERLVLTRVALGEWGVFTRAVLQRDTILGEVTGELVPLGTAEADGQYSTQVPIGRNKVKRHGNQPDGSIEATRCGSIFRYLQHSCDPNAQIVSCRVGGDRRMLIVKSIKPIGLHSPVTIDFGDSWWKDGEKCNCGSSTCRKP